MALPPPSESGLALVTGASSGIGAQIARELGRRGHNLGLVARRAERLRVLAAELADELGVRAEPLPADLTATEDRDRLEARLGELGMEVEILVNNAGFGGNGRVIRAERRRLVEMARVNCEAPLDLIARFAPAMAARRRGAVINIASTAAFQPMPGTATYAATKAFMLSLSEAVHAELADDGITVTTVCPGPVKTEFTEAAGIAGAEERLPELFWTPVEEVARRAVRAAEKGRRTVVPGALNRAGALTGQHSPRALALPIVKRVWSLAGPPR